MLDDANDPVFKLPWDQWIMWLLPEQEQYPRQYVLQCTADFLEKACTMLYRQPANEECWVKMGDWDFRVPARPHDRVITELIAVGGWLSVTYQDGSVVQVYREKDPGDETDEVTEPVEVEA